MGSEGVPGGSKGLPEGSEGLPEGSEGLPEGPEGLPEWPEGLPGGLRACQEAWGDIKTNGWTFYRTFYRTLSPILAAAQKLKGTYACIQFKTVIFFSIFLKI